MKCWPALAITLPLLAIAAIAVGQSPPPGDPEVFLAFLRYQDALIHEINSSKSDGGATSSAESAAAKSFGLSRLEFARVNGAFKVLQTDLDDIDRQGIAYIQQQLKAGALPNVTELQKVEAARRKRIEAAKTEIRYALAPASWNAMMAFVEGEFRGSIQRRALK